jgi:tetratricopeptide (TPR) repeat protein
MRTGRGTAALGAALAFVMLGGLAHAEGSGGPLSGPVNGVALDESDSAVDKAVTEAGRAALEEASAAKRAARKVTEEGREQALLAVATRYDAIAADTAYAVPERTEALFRAGEILRTLKQIEPADSRFGKAVSLGEPVEAARGFAARGLLERAHILRRANDEADALALYAEVGRRFADQRRSAAHARTWTGKLLLRGGRELGRAAEVLQGFAEAFPEYATEAVRNADLVAVAWFEAGDEPAARATEAWIRGRMDPLLAEGGRSAELIGKALERMRVTALLAGD